MRGDLGEQLGEERGLELAEPLLGAEELLLVLLQLGRDEALGADERLLAHRSRPARAPRFGFVTSM